MIQGLDQLQQAADYHFYFRRLRKLGLGLAAFGLMLGGLAWATRDNRWSVAGMAVAAAWILAYAALIGDPLGRGWLRSRPFTGHWLVAAALLIMGGLVLAERRFAPPQAGKLPVTLAPLAIVAIFGIGALIFYHQGLGASLLAKKRPAPGMLKQLDEQIAAIKGGDLARDESLIEFTIIGGGSVRAALRPGMVVLMGSDGHLLFYRRKQFEITPAAPGENAPATVRLDGEQIAVKLMPGAFERYRTGGR
jgi:hypothetical protein